MSDGGNMVPRITKAEHIGPNDTGDNIEAKRTANYVWNDLTDQWERMEQPGGSSGSATGLIPFAFDDIEWSGTPDAFGNYPTATVRESAVDLATLTFTYDADGKLTRVQRT